MKIKRGDIYIVDLGEGFGSEQGGIRPALVVQNNIGNKYLIPYLLLVLQAKQIRNTIYQLIIYFLTMLD